MITLEQLYRLPQPATKATPVSAGDLARVGALQLYGADGKLLPQTAFQATGIDAGPGTPLQPRYPAGKAPREFQYPIGWNYVVTPRGEDRTRMQSFAMLRMFALTCPYLRIAINYRKQQLAGMDWDIVVRDDPKSSKARDKYKAEIAEVKQFFEMPNAFDGVPFATWIKQAYEETSTTDALCMYKLQNRGGGLHSLVQIDGTTIKVLIDEYAHIVGYHQILYGYPVSGYSAWTAEREKADIREFAPGDLVYLIMNPKVDNVYGTPPAEEILSLIQLGMSRISYQTTWYTSGTMPDGYIEAPEEWKTPDQLREGQDYLDDVFAGNDERRHTVRFLPFGSRFTQVTKGLNYSKDEEDALISAVCAYMGVPRSLFVSTVNRATGEMQRDEAQDTGFKPVKLFFRDFFTHQIIEQMFGYDFLEFAWVDAAAGNEFEIAQAAALYVNTGILTANEVRAQKGLEPLEQPEPVAAPPAGQAPPAPGEAPKPAGKPGDAEAGQDGVNQPDGQGTAEKALASELGEWRRFATKRIEKGRHRETFTTSVVPPVMKRVIETGLARARTVEDVNRLFTKAANIAAKRKQYERELKAVVLSSLKRQEKSLLAHAKKDLAA
jgi:hypothetical protein